jgi:hypothetical protein
MIPIFIVQRSTLSIICTSWYSFVDILETKNIFATGDHLVVGKVSDGTTDEHPSCTPSISYFDCK